jgi:hypothetical protein
MDWTTPEMVEIKMDAEIGSYQADDDPAREPVVEESDARDEES